MAELAANHELERARDSHLAHFHQLGDALEAGWFGPEHAQRVRRFEAELDNFREAVAWAFDGASGTAPRPAERVLRGAHMVRPVVYFAAERGHVAEAVRWRERALEWSRDVPFPAALVSGLNMGQTWLMSICGEADRALHYAEAALAAAVEPVDIAAAQKMMALAHVDLGNTDAARSLLEESLDVARALQHDLLLTDILTYLLAVEVHTGDVAAQQHLVDELRLVAARIRDSSTDAWVELFAAEVRWRQGAAAEADRMLHSLVSDVLGFADPMLTLEYADACVIAAAVPPGARIELLGAVDAARKREVRPREPFMDREITAALDQMRSAVGEAADDLLASGGLRTVEDAVRTLWPGA